jgi:malate synthase
VREFKTRNQALLSKRDELQGAIDAWHAGNERAEDYPAFLKRIGYLVPPPTKPAAIETAGVDREISAVAGPQLVCPLDNTRFVLNAANARWGSLLDAVYATNALLPPPPAGKYDAERGKQVFAAVHGLLDELVPLETGSWEQVRSAEVRDGALRVALRSVRPVRQPPSLEPRTFLEDLAPFDFCDDPLNGTGTQHETVGLRLATQLVGFSEVEPDQPGPGGAEAANLSVLLQRNGLHIELLFAPNDSERYVATSLTVVSLRSH